MNWQKNRMRAGSIKGKRGELRTRGQHWTAAVLAATRLPLTPPPVNDSVCSGGISFPSGKGVGGGRVATRTVAVRC